MTAAPQPQSSWEQDFLALFTKVKRQARPHEYVACCPAHGDREPSLSIRFTTKDDRRQALVKCFAGCTSKDIMAAVGKTEADLFEREQTNVFISSSEPPTVVATYPYHDADGTHLADKRRLSNKTFSWRTPDGGVGRGAKKVVYRLHLIQGKTKVVIAEGEKDADALAALGRAATTSPESSWKEEYTDQILAAGATTITVFADNDDKGRKHGHATAQSFLARGITVKLIEFPELPVGGDVSDYLERHSPQELLERVVQTPWYTPGTAPGPVRWRAGSALDATPISFLVENLIPMHMLGAIGGRDGRGKTLLGMEIAKSVLTGQKLFGHFAVQQGNAFLMLLDDPEQLVRERLDALGITNHPNLKVATQKDVDITNPKALLEYLEQTMPAQHPTFTLIDALYKFYPSGGGQDQANSGSAMGPVMSSLTSLTEAVGGGVAVVAHDNKAGSDIAGSQVIRNALIWIVRLVLPQEFEDDAEGAILTPERILQLNKLKMGRTTSWHLRVGPPGQWTFDGDSTQYRQSRLDDRIVVQLFDHGAHTLEELQKALKARRVEVRESCLRLHLAGKITRSEQSSGKGRPRIVYDHPVPRP